MNFETIIIQFFVSIFLNLLTVRLNFHGKKRKHEILCNFLKMSAI